jgi:hypothetical protein
MDNYFARKLLVFSETGCAALGASIALFVQGSGIGDAFHVAEFD